MWFLWLILEIRGENAFSNTSYTYDNADDLTDIIIDIAYKSGWTIEHDKNSHHKIPKIY